ncbi:MAG: hypothetical protein ACI9R3_004651 [Verrucomicrobiales bacterium]|jgi:hypothetical protein
MIEMYKSASREASSDEVDSLCKVFSLMIWDLDTPPSLLRRHRIDFC